MANDSIMIDLETLSADSHAAIIAIGAVKFDRHGHEFVLPPPAPPIAGEKPKPSVIDPASPHFYVNVKVDKVGVHSFDISPDTIQWWFDQSDLARRSLKDPAPQGLTLALDCLTHWVGGTDTAVRVWSHATFDFPILAHAYHAIGKRMPFRYGYARDVRTIYDLAFPDQLVPGVPTQYKHHALWDAYRQAVGVQQCYRWLRGIKIDPIDLALHAAEGGILPGETFSVIPGIETPQQL